MTPRGQHNRSSLLWFTQPQPRSPLSQSSPKSPKLPLYRQLIKPAHNQKGGVAERNTEPQKTKIAVQQHMGPGGMPWAGLTTSRSGPHGVSLYGSPWPTHTAGDARPGWRPEPALTVAWFKSQPETWRLTSRRVRPAEPSEDLQAGRLLEEEGSLQALLPAPGPIGIDSTALGRVMGLHSTYLLHSTTFL